MDNNFKERLLDFLTHLKIGQTKFEEITGLGRASISKIKDGMSAPNLAKITKAYPELDITWLLTGEGEMLKGTQLNVEEETASTGYTLKQLLNNHSTSIDTSKVDKELLQTDIKQLSDEDISKVAYSLNIQYDDLKQGIELSDTQTKGGKMVPVFNTAAAAGDATIELTGNREGWVNVGDLLKDSEGALYVYGNSMIPGYPPGALLGLKKRLDSFIEPGSVYVVQTKSNRYVKRLYYNKQNTGLMCISDNHLKHDNGPLQGEYFYPPFDIPFEEVVYIWDVTGVIKRNKAIMI